MINEQPIGVFDSGVGGISTLKTLTTLLPNESFVFYGDSVHAPYGNKTDEEVYNLTKTAFEFLISKHVKAIVIACNTATSAAKEKLIRDYPELPIVGIEPALKEAIDAGHQNILVMGTPLTISLPKYQASLNNYKDSHHIISVPCPGLADYVEQGMSDPNKLNLILNQFLGNLSSEHFGVIVLGCTHYPFLKEQIIRYFDPRVQIFTGYEGVGKQLKHLLTNSNMQQYYDQIKQSVEFFSSQPRQTNYYKLMFDTFNV